MRVPRSATRTEHLRRAADCVRADLPPAVLLTVVVRHGATRHGGRHGLARTTRPRSSFELARAGLVEAWSVPLFSKSTLMRWATTGSSWLKSSKAAVCAIRWALAQTPWMV